MFQGDFTDVCFLTYKYTLYSILLDVGMKIKLLLKQEIILLPDPRAYEKSLCALLQNTGPIYATIANIKVHRHIQEK